MLQYIIIGLIVLLIVILIYIIYYFANKLNKVSNALGIYENLIEFSQEGGMSTVYKAKNSKTGKTCILKVLRQEMVNDKNVYDKFFSEPEIIDLIKKDDRKVQIPDIYSYGKLRDKLVKLPYIEMEYIQGDTSIRDYLKEKKVLSIHETDLVISKLLAIITVAHKNNIIHRDLKPENILLRYGDINQPVIIDYGIAKIQGTQKTQSVAYLSPEYMAPEQSNSINKLHTSKLDIYQLGTIMYEMLTGERLFYDTNPLNIINSHLNESPDKKIEKNIPKERQEILKHLLQKDIEKRPDADYLLDYFNQISSNHRIQPFKIKNDGKAIFENIVSITKNYKNSKTNNKINFVKYIRLSIIVLIVSIVLIIPWILMVQNNEKPHSIEQVYYKIIPYSKLSFNKDGIFLSYNDLEGIYNRAMANEYPLINRIITHLDPPYFIVDPQDIRLVNDRYRCKKMIVVNKKITNNNVSYKFVTLNPEIIRQYKRNIFCIKLDRSAR